MRKNLTEIVFILDRSGSMSGLEADTIGGFNSMIEKQKKTEGEALISTVLFDNASEVIHDRVSVQNIKPMTDEDYTVRGCTALLDAIGGAIHHIGNVHKYARAEDVPEHKLLQESYLGKVKMIYIDPPYNTGNDFIYADDFMRSQEEENEQMGMYDEDDNRLFKNTDTNGRFHSDWCSMIYSRLMLARNLLTDDGFIFISIGEEEIDNMYAVCNEVYGRSRHLGTFIWKRRQMVDSRSKTGVSEDHEYLLCYAKSASQRIRGAKADMGKYSNPDNDPRGDWMSADMTGLATASQRPNLHYEFSNPQTGIVYSCPPLGWRYDRKHMEELIKNNEVIWPAVASGRPRRKKFAKD